MSLPYLPLDESKDEIRLITLFPKSTRRSRSRSEVVQCKLETRSLKSYTREYEVFTSSPSFTSLSKHISRINWSQSQYQPGGGSLEELSPSQNIESSENCHRFTWGDYAALSYVWGDESKTCKIIVNGYEQARQRLP